jgi:predicted ATPase
VRELAEALLRGCLGLQILATSRERLHVAGEVTWTVPPLDPPTPQQHDDPAALAQVPSVRLFLDRVRLHRPDIVLTRENAHSVAAICRRLDGLPLALELAAARTAVLSLDQLATRLGGALGLLTTRNRALPERQQTLRATIDWSFSLLAPEEQRLLAQLAVFDGGCTLAAIEAVTDADPLAVLDSLAVLADHSLIQRLDTAAGEPRFRMLELVREYAQEQLAASSEEAATREWHADYFLRLAESAPGMEQIAWQRMLLAEEDNLRAALRWAIAAPQFHIALRFGNALSAFWAMRGAFREGRAWLDALLELTAADATATSPRRALRAQTLYGAMFLAWQGGDTAGAGRYGEQALAEFRALDDRHWIARTLRLLSSVALITGQDDLVRQYLDEAETLLRALGNRHDLATVLNSRGEVARYLDGDYRLAEALYREALALARTDGTTHWVALVLSNVAIVVLRRGGSNEALRLLHECLELRLELGYQRGIAICLEISGAAAITLGRFAQAARFYGAAEQLRRAIDSPRTSDPADVAEHQHYLDIARERTDPATWAADWAAGAALPLDQLVTEALVMSGTPPRVG